MNSHTDSVASLVRQTVERCLLSIVAIFVATILVGITVAANNPEGAPRTVDLHQSQATATH